MLSTRPATPFPPSPVLGEEKKDLPTENNTHITPPPKTRIPSRLPSLITPRGASFRSMSERRSGERPTFDLSSGPVPAIFRNKRIDMNRLKNIDPDEAFGPSKRRSISGTSHTLAGLVDRGSSRSISGTSQSLAGLVDRGSSIMSASRLHQADLMHQRLSCSVNGR